MSIYLLHHAVRDQRVGAGRADHNHDLGGGSIEDLGLVQGDRWGRPRHRWGWPVRVVDQGGSAQDLDLGGGSGGPGHGTPQAFNSAVDLPRARRGRRQRSIGPGRAVDQGGSVRDVGLGGGSVEDLGLVQGDRWGRPRHRRSWPARVVDQGGSAQDLDLGGGSGGPGHGTPQAFNSAVDLPRARLGRRQRSIGPGRAVDQGGSARDVGLGGGSVEDLGMNASTLERIRFAAANRLCVDVGYEGDVQRVEPYSLRKARGGNVVLYACEAGSSECATYRTGGISEVEVTRQTFVPKYANELLSPGR